MNLMFVFGIATAIFLLVMLGMAIGVMVGRKAISGSCGGLGNQPDADGESKCSLCQNPSEACRELTRRMHSDTQETGS